MKARVLQKFMIAVLPMTILIISACANGGNNIHYDDVSGEWELIHAERNGIVTNTFERAVFNFGRDSTLETNIPNLEKLGRVSIEGNKLNLESNKMENTTLEIIDSTQNMQISSDIQGFKFVFILEKK